MENILLTSTTLSTGVNPNSSILSLLSKATTVSKFAMLLLLVFSIVSWAIIIFKLIEYSKAKNNSEKFVDHFRRTKNFSEINKFASTAPGSPLAIIFRYGYKELSQQMGPNNAASNINMECLNRSLVRASNTEITRLERLNGFLATTASVSPFVGLFGTVWGIFTAFQQIGEQMNANLATVAPGIAEALIATALGLFAAIPAVIFYNLLLNKLKVMIASMEDFILEFLNVSEKLK
ncbi:MAG: biopolymer transport protein TolQ [Acidobacteriota bacterium]|nr:biopolymer transport protein TolQ [Acidobacteriota bacterium]